MSSLPDLAGPDGPGPMPPGAVVAAGLAASVVPSVADTTRRLAVEGLEPEANNPVDR